MCHRFINARKGVCLIRVLRRAILAVCGCRESVAQAVSESEGGLALRDTYRMRVLRVRGPVSK